MNVKSRMLFVSKKMWAVEALKTENKGRISESLSHTRATFLRMVAIPSQTKHCLQEMLPVNSDRKANLLQVVKRLKAW